MGLQIIAQFCKFVNIHVSACSMFSVLVSRMSRQMSYELSASRDMSVKPGTCKPLDASRHPAFGQTCGESRWRASCGR